MKIPVFSSTIRRREMDAVLTCLVDEKPGPGEMSQRLTQQVKEFFNVDGAVALRSPSLALKYALKSLDTPLGTGVMISALAPSWQYSAVIDLGYTPIILDVSPDSSLVTPEIVETGIKNGGRVLLLHESCGLLPDLKAILAFGIPVIEDISQNAGAAVEQTPDTSEAGDAFTAGSNKAAYGGGTDPVEPEMRKVGTFGVYSILGLEERDIITGGGGAVLMAPSRREWIVLKRFVDVAPSTDILPDMNSALAFVQLREFNRNEQIRREIRSIYERAILQLQGRHKTFVQQGTGVVPVVYSFPVVLSSGVKDVKQYAERKEIDIEQAFTDTVISKQDESFNLCPVARSLTLRCVMFPLYPRLGNATVAKIAKVLGTLP